MPEPTFRSAIAFLEGYYGAKINDTVYRTLWEYMRRFHKDKIKKLCEKIVFTFRPTAQNPFPLVIHFVDAEDAIEEESKKLNYRIPDYEMLPEPDEYITEGEIAELFKKLPWLK